MNFHNQNQTQRDCFQMENIFQTKYKGKMWLIWLALDMSENVNDHPGGDLMKLAGWMQSSLVEIRATSRVVGISSDIGVSMPKKISKTKSYQINTFKSYEFSQNFKVIA